MLINTSCNCSRLGLTQNTGESAAHHRVQSVSPYGFSPATRNLQNSASSSFVEISKSLPLTCVLLLVSPHVSQHTRPSPNLQNLQPPPYFPPSETTSPPPEFEFLSSLITLCSSSRPSPRPPSLAPSQPTCRVTPKFILYVATNLTPGAHSSNTSPTPPRVLNTTPLSHTHIHPRANLSTQTPFHPIRSMSNTPHTKR